jgi:hypothetical protein
MESSVIPGLPVVSSALWPFLPAAKEACRLLVVGGLAPRNQFSSSVAGSIGLICFFPRLLQCLYCISWWSIQLPHLKGAVTLSWQCIFASQFCKEDDLVNSGY